MGFFLSVWHSLGFKMLLIHSSDETHKAPPTLVTRCYVPHFHHYGYIGIEFLQIKSDENNEDVH